MRRLRLALVLNRFWPEVGGAETNLYFQAVELARRHDVTVYTPRRLAETPAREEHRGFRIRRLLDLRNLPARYPNLAARTLLPGLFPRLLAGRYDVVQAFPAVNPNTELAFRAARLSGARFILCSFDFIDYAALIEAGGGRIDPDAIARHVASRREETVLRGADHVFGISEREIAFFRRYTSRTSYSPVPVLTTEYATLPASPRARYGVPDDSFVYLCLGRVSAIKGQDLALEAFARVAARTPGSRLVIVGRADYEGEFCARLRSRAVEAGIADRVVFTGMVERPDVIAWLATADAHVVPVRFMNSGAVVAETWAAGTVVIQSDAVDPNYVVDGENGWLFRSGDIDGLAARMLEAWHARDRLPAMAERGRRFVLEQLTYDRLVEIYEAVYARLLPRAG